MKKKVYVYDEDLNLLKTFESTASVEKEGYNQGNVVRSCQGILKRYKGLIWSYTPLTSIEERTDLENSQIDKRTAHHSNVMKAIKRYNESHRDLNRLRLLKYYYKKKREKQKLNGKEETTH